MTLKSLECSEIDRFHIFNLCLFNYTCQKMRYDCQQVDVISLTTTCISIDWRTVPSFFFIFWTKGVIVIPIPIAVAGRNQNQYLWVDRCVMAGGIPSGRPLKLFHSVLLNFVVCFGGGMHKRRVCLMCDVPSWPSRWTPSWHPRMCLSSVGTVWNDKGRGTVMRQGCHWLTSLRFVASRDRWGPTYPQCKITMGRIVIHPE